MAFYYPHIVDKLRFFAECLPPDGYRPFTSVIIANTRDFFPCPLRTITEYIFLRVFTSLLSDIFKFCEICIIFVYCFGSFAQYVDMYVDNYVDNVSILLYVLLYYYINTKICSYSPDPKQTYVRFSVKWEKTDGS